MLATTKMKKTVLVACASGAFALSVAQAAPTRDDTETSPRWDTYRHVKYYARQLKLDLVEYVNAIAIANKYWGDLWPDNTYTITGDLDGNGTADSATLTDNNADEDQTPDDGENEALEAWRNLLMLLVRISGAIEDLGLNGTYDGTVYDPQGNSAEAVLDLTAQNGETNGDIWVVERGLSLDTGGWGCPTVDVPVSVLTVSATNNGLYDSTGNFQRDISIGPFNATIYGDYTMTLSQNDYDTLTMTLNLDVPWPCSDQTLTGVFDRRW